eukprot:jgi/Chrzof1/2286/Cz11g09260.t1
MQDGMPTAQQPQHLQQAAPVKTSFLDQILSYKTNLENDLVNVEKNIAEMEAAYLQAEYSQPGTVLKGFEGFLSSKDALRKRQRTYKPEDRLFSLSSRTSPVTKELEAEEAIEAVASGGFGKKGYASKGYAQKGYAQKGKR